MLAHTLAEAYRRGYRPRYLMTLCSMTAPNRRYGTLGFRPLDEPMGKTGHFSCDAWYINELRG